MPSNTLDGVRQANRTRRYVGGRREGGRDGNIVLHQEIEGSGIFVDISHPPLASAPNKHGI